MLEETNTTTIRPAMAGPGCDAVTPAGYYHERATVQLCIVDGHGRARWVKRCPACWQLTEQHAQAGDIEIRSRLQLGHRSRGR